MPAVFRLAEANIGPDIQTCEHFGDVLEAFCLCTGCARHAGPLSTVVHPRESYGCDYLIPGSLYLLLTYCLHGAAGIGLISDVIDFSQADDGAMIAYGLSDQLDDLKVRSPEARLADFVNFWVPCHGLMCGNPWTAMLTIVALHR